MREQIKGDKNTAATFDRMAEHLAANGIDLEKTKPVLGDAVNTNPMTEKFVQNKKANQFWRRAPRPDFEIKVG